MANRTTKVTLIAEVNNYVAGMQKAAQQTKELGNSAEKLQQQREGFNTLGTAALAVGAVAAAGVGLAVAKFAEFDAQMSSVQAATHESASNMQLLREAALQAGADTVFSATEAAQAQEELAKAGVSTADILGGGLRGALDLASAGSLDVASAAEIAATAMTQFGLAGNQVPHIADLLAAGAGKAQGSVEDLSQALNQGGLVASQTGLSIEETTGTLSAFASAGLLGSDAGTSFKTMLQRLTPQSAEAKAKMDELGISAYDAQGNFIGMTQFAGVLQDALKDLSPEARNSALSVIFGSDAVRAASVIYEQGADGIQDWIDKTNDSGYAAETAATKLDNLQGDLEALSGAFDTALIQSGSGANDVLRGLVQTTTNLVNSFSALPGPMQGAVTVVGAVTAGIGLLGGAALLAVPKIVEFRTAMASLNLSGGAIARGFGKGGAILLGVTALASGFANLSAQTSLTEDQMSNLNNTLKSGSLDALNEQFHDASGAIVGAEEDLHGFKAALDASFSGDINKNEAVFYKFVDGLSFGLTGLSDRATTNEAKFRAMGDQLAELAQTDLTGAVEQFQQYVDAAGGGEEAVRMLLLAFPAYKAALTDLYTAQGQTASEQDILNAAVGQGAVIQSAMRDQTARTASGLADMSASAQDATGSVEDLADSIRNFAQGQFDMNAAQRDFEQAVDDATSSLEAQKAAYEEANGSAEGFVATLDIGTQEGRDNAAALDQIASSANASAAAIYAQTGSQDEATAALGRGREALIAQLGQFGITGQAADDYIAKLLATPDSIATQVNLNAQQAKAELDDFVRQLNSIPGRRDVVINQVVQTTGAPQGQVGAAYNANGGMYSYANGGFGEGIYPGRAGALYRFAEPETGWEAFISGRPGQERRNAGIAMNALARLGYGGMGAGGGTIAVSPVVSLAGARILLEVGGRQIEGVIQDQIAAADSRSEMVTANGWRSDV